MAFNPKEQKFLHSLPTTPGIKPVGIPGLKPVSPMTKPGAVAPMARPHVGGITPGVMPMPGQKHVGPPANRWNKLQQYLDKPAAPISPVAAPMNPEAEPEE